MKDTLKSLEGLMEVGNDYGDASGTQKDELLYKVNRADEIIEKILETFRISNLGNIDN
jgi:hypothetical protein